MHLQSIEKLQSRIVFSDMLASPAWYFCLRKSDIASLRSAVILYSPPKLAKRIPLGVSRISLRSNRTRRKANITEKSKSQDLLFSGWGSRIRTYECQSQSLVPYRLAIPQNIRFSFDLPNGFIISHSFPIVKNFISFWWIFWDFWEKFSPLPFIQKESAPHSQLLFYKSYKQN